MTYQALARSMHELGSPYHKKGYLRTMAEALGDRLEIHVIEKRFGHRSVG